MVGELNEAAVRAMMQKIVEVAEKDAAKLLRCQKNAEQDQAAAPQDVIGALSQELHYVEPWQPVTPKQPNKLSRFVAQLGESAFKIKDKIHDQIQTLTR